MPSQSKYIFFFPHLSTTLTGEFLRGSSLYIICSHFVVMGHYYDYSKSRTIKQAKHYNKRAFVLFFQARYLWFQTDVHRISSFHDEQH